MWLGWQHGGYEPIVDPEPEDSMGRHSPPLSERGEQGGEHSQLHGLVNVNADAETAINASNGTAGNGSLFPAAGPGAYDRMPRDRGMTWNDERPLPASPFVLGRRSFRARFMSEDTHPGRPSSTSSGLQPSGKIARKRPLWRRIRWQGSASPDEGQTGPAILRRNSLGSGYTGVSSGWGTVPGKVPDLLQVEFDPDYDTSRPHLVKLFKSLDKNGMGTITYETMRMGLANLHTYSDLNYVMRKADMHKTKELTLDDFVETVQEHAAKMFAAKQDLPVSCFCYDYSPNDVAFRWVKTGRPNPPSPSVSVRGLMSERRDSQGAVRWVCVTGSDPSLVIHMANRYGIHPLQVEDCLNPKERLKVDAFRAPAKPAEEGASKAKARATVTVAEPAPKKPLNDQEETPARCNGPQVVSPPLSTWKRPKSPVPVFAGAGTEDRVGAVGEAGGTAPGTQAVVSSSSSGKVNGSEDIIHVVLGRISLRTPTVGRPSNFEREQVSIFLIGDHTVLFIEPSPSAVSDQISNRIYYAGSKLRLNNARYLVYSLMDTIVDDIFPIMQHFQTWLVQLQEELHSVNDGPSLEIMRAIQQISRDMHMITFYLRPMKMVATQLITDLPRNDADLKRHLEDLRDHLLMLEEQALRMSTWSRSLNKDWVNEQQHRMNQVVYILTMVTSAFMPAQFLTGVFGMNFKFMPELNWRYSYASFWVLVALLAFTSYTVYKRHKWL